MLTLVLCGYPEGAEHGYPCRIGRSLVIADFVLAGSRWYLSAFGGATECDMRG